MKARLLDNIRVKRMGCVMLGLVCLVAFESPAQAQTDPSARPLSVATGTEVVAHWQPHQHLYVKGDLGVNQSQLDALENWLDQNAPHWTVVLLESAQGEQFTDAEGRSFQGMDAVEHALGKGLPNRTAFGQWTDPRTGERDGAFFVLFLKDRKFSYFASDAMDRRGLGEDRWQGRLDQPAIAAMRSGGRVVDAVKDTVTSISRQLTQRIEAEKADATRREAEAKAMRQRALELAQAAFQRADESVSRLDRSLSEWRRSEPNMDGDLARPDLAAMRADLTSASAALENGNPSAAKALADTVQVRAVQAEKAIADHRAAGPALQEWNHKLDQLAAHPFAAAGRVQLDEARAALAEARQAHARGDSAYVKAMTGLEAAWQRAGMTMRAAEVAATQRLWIIRITSGAGFVALLALGVGLNLRRRGSRREALALVEAWKQGLGEKTVALFELLDRAHGVLGDSAEEAARRYQGRSLALSQQIIQDVDELMIMSACAGRVLESAQVLAQPADLGARCVNTFAVRRYRTATRRLRDEPVAFRHDDGLELVVRGPKSERETLLGRLENYQPFTMSFQELIEAFNQRARRALSALEQVENALRTMGDALESTRVNIEEGRNQEGPLGAAGGDPLFRVRGVFTELLSAAQLDYAEATRQAVRDPVGALETSLAAARQKAAAALALMALALAYHQTHKPRLVSAAQMLGAVPLDTRWLEAAAQALSRRADEAAHQALTSSIADVLPLLKQDMEALVGRAEQTVALDKKRRDEMLPSVAAVAATIENVRAELSVATGLAASRILCEPAYDPVAILNQAREQVAGAKAALERGDVEAAQGGLDDAAHRVIETQGLIEATQAAVQAHAATLASCREETARLEATLPAHDSILAEIRHRYVPAVLLLGDGDTTHPRANDTVEDNLDEARVHLVEVRALTDRAASRHREAAFLEAAECLRQAAARQEQTRFRLQEIEDKQQRLQSTETANAQRSTNLEQQASELEASAHDARTMASTLRAFTQARERLAEAVRQVVADRKDPFAVAAELAKVGEALEFVGTQTRNDWDAHARAERSLQTVSAEWDKVRGLAAQAESDGVEDSATLQQTYRDENALAVRIETVRASLSQPHGDWTEVNTETGRILGEIARLAAVTRGELEAAQNALAALNLAASATNRLGGWRGGYGVTILGAPGADALARARSALAAGLYMDAIRAAQTAEHAARQAIAEAEAEARRRQRAEEERQEQERRRRAAEERRRNDSWSHSNSGFGHSSFSSRSGASHSSFSRGSGTARSGW